MVLGASLPAQAQAQDQAQTHDQDQDLASKLDPLAAGAESLGWRTGVVVLDPRTKRTLYRHRAQELFVPASNQKLLTVAAALKGLGADYRFRTVFRLREGILEVVAGGDPNWQTGGAHDPTNIFAEVVKRLQAAGVRSLKGIRLRQGRFVGPQRPPGWPQDQLHNDYCAATAGLAMDAGCFLARVVPGDGKVAAVEVLAPSPSLPVEGHIQVVASRGARFGLRDTGAHLLAHGAIHRNSPPRTVSAPLHDPAKGFGRYLSQGLTRGGIRVAADAPALHRHLLTYETPLREALPPILRDSSNFHAELLLRVLGVEREGDGSYAGGARAVRAQLEALVGKLPAGLAVVDGSGLSDANRLTPALLAEVLAATVTSKPGKELALALAQGQRTGTLERRFRGQPFATKVFAKTGTLNGVTCLSGLLTDARGRLRIFAICMNTKEPGRVGKGSTMRKIQEDVVAAIWEAGNDR